MASLLHFRRLSRALLIAAVFLCMQVAAVTHAATFGNDRHTHDGAPCSIQQLSDGPATPTTSCQTPALAPVSALQKFAVYDHHSTVSLDHSRAIRGPPALSD